MGLGFLAPAFLLGLAALAVPVAIHLVHRQRARTLDFPSLMFLQRVPFPSVRRRRIRDWVLLALRCLALALLVAAFARPFLRRSAGGAGAGREAREVVILLDRSYSMGMPGRWAAARAAAERVIAGLRNADRASLVVFDEDARVAGPPTSDRDRLRAELAAADVGWARTRYGPALELAASLLAASRRPSLEAVLISDYQRGGWDGDASARLPAGARLTAVDVGGEVGPNLAIASATFRRDRTGGAQRVTPAVRVVNTGGGAARDVALQLSLGGRAVETRDVTLDAGAATTVAFTPFVLSDPVRGEVKASTDALDADNVFSFALEPDPAVPVLVLDGGNAGRSLYLRRALDLGASPGFRAVEISARRLGAANLPRRGVVILDDAPFPGGEAGRVLTRWVKAGGGLIVVAGPGSAGGGEAAALLPGEIGPTVDPDGGRGAALGRVDFAHPVFEPFSAPHSGDFSAARFFRHRSIRLADSATALARFDDGAVALAERRVGRGRVLLWASTLDTFWNDLALQPVFLPFVHRLVEHAAGYAPPRASLTVGDVWDPRADEGAPTGGSLVALTPSGASVPLGDPPASSAVSLLERGFYELRGESADGRVVAVNVDASESRLARLDPQELTAAVTRPGDSGPAAAAELAPEEKERRQGWWWYLLFGAFVLFAAETVVSNRLSTQGGRHAPAR